MNVVGDDLNGFCIIEVDGKSGRIPHEYLLFEGERMRRKPRMSIVKKLGGWRKSFVSYILL